MNNRFRFVTALVAIATAAVIAACATSGTSSAPPTSASASTPLGQLASPAGQKKVGPYIWVWKSKNLTPKDTFPRQIEVDCPSGYAAIGGGYRNPNGYLSVLDSHPNLAFDGWIVTAFDDGYFSERLTANVSCAPLK
jgi:ABC-type Fe3+-hydroxamate transport system substrate-binding protein